MATLIILIKDKVSDIILKDNKSGDSVIKEVENGSGNEVEDNPNYVETTSKGYILEKIDGAYYIDGYIIVNKSYPFSDSWIPSNTEEEINNDICKNCLDKEVYNMWSQMKNDATSIGLNIYISSGYRSFSYQKGLYEHYINKGGKDYADITSARAGHSEHQSGLAFDLNSVDDSFSATDEGKWVNNNAHLYGFIIRYPKDKTNETGYKYESWHLRYVGTYLADKLYNNGNWITMEDYFGLDSQY
ncbi:MAG: M15 family metallopeptidase [Bacilli bacterium]